LIANIFWALAYDTEYAMVDRDDDIRLGIRTAAITFGRFDVIAIMVCYGIALGMIALAGWYEERGLFFYLGIAVAAALSGYHFGLIRDRSREGCFKAFNHNNWLGAAIFAGLALDYAIV
jgi:4-hydroxybenzoate polyprenyltransferase